MTELSCGVAADLLPLYADGVCGEESRALLDLHLAKCRKCRALLAELQGDTVTGTLIPEATDVLERQRKRFTRKGRTAGLILSAVLAVPLFVLLIISLAKGQFVAGFSVVFAALLLGFSLIAVPFLAPKQKYLCTASASVFSLFFLLLCAELYGGGHWFFVAAASVAFGLSATLLPVTLSLSPFREKCVGHRLPITVLASSLFFFLMMFAVCLRAESTAPLRVSAAIVLPLLLLFWLVYFTVRRRCPVLLKIGVLLLLFSLFFFSFESVADAFFGLSTPLPSFETHGAFYWIVFFGSLLSGIALTAAGFLKVLKRGK